MGINNAAARAKSTAQDVVSFGQRQVDRAVPPATRQKTYEGVGVFAQERPILFSLIATQLLFASLPLLCFLTFVVSAAGAAFASALLFALFWTGVALFVFLVPALLLASAVAALVWIWTVSAFLVARWVYFKAQTTQSTQPEKTNIANKLAAVHSGKGGAGVGAEAGGDVVGHIHGGGVQFSTNPDPGLTDVRYGSSNGGDDGNGNGNGNGDVKKEGTDETIQVGE